MTGRRVPLDEPLLSMAETAVLLGVPLQTFRRWRKHHYGPVGYRLGKAVNFRRVEVEAWLQQQKEAPGPTRLTALGDARQVSA